MHHILTSVGRRFAHTPVGMFARDLTGMSPYKQMVPGSWCGKKNDYAESISDAFIYRCSEQWRTRFDLMNLPSLMMPSDPVDDRATLIFFSQEGIEIDRVVIELKPFEVRPILVGDILGKKSDFGIFSVFHERKNTKGDWPFKTCLSERGYVSYQVRDGSCLWSYVLWLLQFVCPCV